MKYQFELKIHGKSFNLQTDEDDFSLYLYKSILEDFEIEENNSRLITLIAYVKSVYELYLHERAVDEMIDKIELLI